MKLCDYQHEEIIHDERDCPLCEAIEKVNKLEGCIENLRQEIEDLESTIDEMETE